MKAALTLVALGLTLSHALAAGPVGVMTLDLENKANGWRCSPRPALCNCCTTTIPISRSACSRTPTFPD